MKKIISLILALIMVLGMAVPAMAATVTIGSYVYMTDENGIMAYSMMNKNGLYGYGEYSGKVFNIFGKHAGNWKQTAFNNQGFATAVLFDGENKNNRGGYHQYKPTDGNVCTIDDKLSLALDFEFTNEGKTLQIIYTVKNISSEEIKYSLASGTDVQIGGDDSATITALGEPGSEYGFKMVSDSGVDYDSTNGYAQFNFFGANREGVTPVSGFWYGGAIAFGENLFNDLKDKTQPYSSDAGCAWHWNDTLAAGGTRVFSVLIGIGGEGSENVGVKSNTDYVNTEYGGAVLTQDSADASTKIDFTKDSYELIVKVDGNEINPSKYDVIVDEDDKYTLKVVFKVDVGVVPGINDGSEIEIVARKPVTGNGETTYIEAKGSAISKYITDIFKEELTEAPGELTVDEAKELLKDEIDEAFANIGEEKVIKYKYMDINLKKLNPDGITWENVDNNKIPQNGIDVVIPYPDGTDSENFAFVVSHIKSDSTVENLEVVETAEGLKFNVKSFSPFAVGYYVDNVSYLPQTYTVTYKADGVVIYTETVEEGKDVVNVPAIPVKEGYTQTAPIWDKDGKNITANTEINALYTINEYNVTYYADGVQVGEPQTVEHGADATAPAIPEKEGYTQTAPIWDKDGKNITADTEINALYTINEYNVKYYIYGKLVDEQVVKHGSNAVVPEFDDILDRIIVWDHDGENITEDTDINGKLRSSRPANRPVAEPEEKTEDEINPGTGAPVFVPAIALVSAAALYITKKR